MNTINQARQLLSDKMSELGYPFSSYYEKETLNLMIEFAKLKCKEQIEECADNIFGESKQIVLECNNVCDE